MPTPSAMNMKFKFPEFVSADNATIEFALEEGQLACKSTQWVDNTNKNLAIMYYAAHLLQVSIMRAQSGSGQVISSEATPDLKITYAVPQQPDMSKPIDFTMTIYGVRFLELVRNNFPAIVVVGGPSA